tara:strand:- start:461 stop:1285 length:825 start_codon:yes stop_codon:yes gene_type:complete
MRELITVDNPIKDYSEMYADAFVDVREKLDSPPLALSIGGHEYRGEYVPSRFGTYGNFSCIVGASKSRKSFLKSLLSASYIGGQSIEYAPEIQGYRDSEKFILDFDTEQGKFDSQNTFKRTCRIVGSCNDLYKPFSLRKFGFNERLEFIEYCILDKFKDKVGLVLIDGFADLVSDTNDLTQANEMVQKLMMWTDVSQCHLIGVIHQVGDTQKATGHLGSAIQKKAETVCFLKYIDKTTTQVHFKYNRGYPIDDFEFAVGMDGLPRTQDIEDGEY